MHRLSRNNMRLIASLLTGRYYTLIQNNYIVLRLICTFCVDENASSEHVSGARKLIVGTAQHHEICLGNCVGGDLSYKAYKYSCTLSHYQTYIYIYSYKF